MSSKLKSDVVDRLAWWLDDDDCDEADQTLRDARDEIVGLRAKLDAQSLRDTFAAAALTGLMGWKKDDGEAATSSDIARWSYHLADAMLAVRAAHVSPQSYRKHDEKRSISDTEGAQKMSESDSLCPLHPVVVLPPCVDGDGYFNTGWNHALSEVIQSLDAAGVLWRHRDE